MSGVHCWGEVVSGRHLGGVVWLPSGGREDVLVPLVPLSQDHLDNERLGKDETKLLSGEGAGQGGARSRRIQEREGLRSNCGRSRLVKSLKESLQRDPEK